MSSRYLIAVAALSLTGLPPSSPERPPSFPHQIVHRGVLTREDYERVIEHRFIVPAGASRLEISLSHTGSEARTVIDLGLRGPSGLRGWSGGRETRVDVSTTSTTPGYLPGPIEPGEWRLLLGIANIREARQDTYLATITVDDEPLMPSRVISAAAGWYAGDLHTHSGHSDGSARSARGARVPVPPHRVFEQARAAGLDFVLLSDHNTASHWLDVDRLQPYFDDLLLLHGREVTTYRGHANTVGERRFLPFHPAAHETVAPILRPIVSSGAFVSINHPLRPDDERCMGCGWNDAAGRIIGLVHGVEVINGDSSSGPDFGWPFWADLLNRGFRLTAVGGSDDHTPDDPSDRAPGRPTTVVWAHELSESALVEGLKRGRVYVRAQGADGPHVELSARFASAIYRMGDAVDARASGLLELTVDAAGAAGQRIEWIRNGRVEHATAVSGAPAAWQTRAHPGDWFSVVLRRDGAVTALSNAIYFGRAVR
jgi:predicted metal-dependent phosphoesterase TrpH